MISFVRVPTRYRLFAVAGVAAVAVAACGSSSGTSAAANPGTTTGAGPQILPVRTNPISNTATAQTLNITKVLVENNVDPATKKSEPDHIEIALSDTGTAALAGFEVYYTITDSVSKASESYYTQLPTSFSVPAGGSRTIHFDNTGKPDHFPVNQFDLFHTSKHPLTVKVEVSATGAAPQTAVAQKAAGGAEGAN